MEGRVEVMPPAVSALGVRDAGDNRCVAKRQGAVGTMLNEPMN